MVNEAVAYPVRNKSYNRSPIEASKENLLCRLCYTVSESIHWNLDKIYIHTYSVSQKNPPEIFCHFFPNGWEFLVQILRAYCTFLSTLEYQFLFNYLQFWRSNAILSATTIIRSKCSPSAETHAGWSHLIWHNFVTVRDNCTTICSLTYVGTCNRCVKFGKKNPTVLEKCQKMPVCISADGGHFCAYDVNWVVTHNKYYGITS